MKFGQLQALYHQPLFDLISKSRAVHLQHWRGEEVQRCSLLSIKTGGCSEDCAYCAQSAHYSTGLEREELLSLEEVMTAAHRARSQGATRFCMGAAWRGVRDGSEKFERVLEIVREVSQLGMEVCVTLGEIGSVEAHKPKAAGVTAYNHNLDTSPEFYPEIVSTHTFQDRLDTIAAVQESGMSVCCGGIIGIGETEADRLRMLEVLSTPRSASGKCADQLFNADPGHTTGRSTGSRHFRAGSFDCGNTNRTAEGASSPGSSAPPAVTRVSGTLFPRRREFNFLRRHSFNREECRCWFLRRS